MAKPKAVPTYLIHPLANKVPPINANDFTALKEDIRKNGLIHPLELYEGKVLDGRSRCQACAELGIIPKTKQYTGKDPLAYIWSLNGSRRHLTDDQKATFAASMAKELQETEGKKAKTAGQKSGGRGRKKTLAPNGAKVNGRVPKSAEKAAIAIGVSRRKTERALALERADKKLFDKVQSGEVKLAQAEKQVKAKQKAKHPSNKTLAETYPLSTAVVKRLNDHVAFWNHIREEHGTFAKMASSKQWDKQETKVVAQLLRTLSTALGRLAKEAEEC